jgi:hypothetical protein
MTTVRLSPDDCRKILKAIERRNLMQLPPFVYVLAFWQALAYVIAALVAWLTPYKLEAGVLLVLVLAILKMFNIVPEVRARKAAQLWGDTRKAAKGDK